jgi:hypothetical protein
MLFIQAFIDFTILSQYISHDKLTIQYLAVAIYRINKIKDIFLLFQLSKAKLLHFNIPKLYTITYYPESIQRLKAIKSIDIEYLE